jgi:ribose/xylose/arabinose/galactoside ABC-type transport system permease subunit
MEVVIFGIVLFFTVIGNIIGAVGNNKDESSSTLYKVSLVLILIFSFLIGVFSGRVQPIEQYQTKQEWKPRLQINQVGDKQDTIYIYNLKDTAK